MAVAIKALLVLLITVFLSSRISARPTETSSAAENSTEVVNASTSGGCDILPDRFYGHFELDHTENFEKRWSFNHSSKTNPNYVHMTVTFERTNDPRKFNYKFSWDNHTRKVLNIEMGKPFGEEKNKDAETFFCKNESIYRYPTEHIIEGDFLILYPSPEQGLPWIQQKKFVLKRQRVASPLPLGPFDKYFLNLLKFVKLVSQLESE
ncbi:hypothetical protein GCK72_026089 [Caenorhabditis remanei]|uniref:Uncharacterized protein n=1 Tax=Caenorhabditis remanei TaxID=31234 RepID=A0A6A5G4H2_CAERE|nr:hypothetical protein GCK72_026089 [Caenorhabditis remanei]KAF1749621.1 hypothetical protein GCK72_026089 [Caenorhabditis remanei]